MRIILSFLLVATLSACIGTNDLPVDGKPAHHTEGGFKNVYVEDPQKNLFSFLRMKYFGGYEWADHEALAHTVPTKSADIDRIVKPEQEVQITWLGHSTFLIQVNGVNIMTDPVFADRAFSSPLIGPKRYSRHVVDYDKLPDIDYVVISHNHYDHLDREATKRLGNRPIYMVPLGLRAWYESEGIRPDRVIEFDWWDKEITDGVSVQALPSQHWSARGIWDRRETLWASWALEVGGQKIWFAGDTGYNDVQFKEIGEKAGPFDVALIPIGAYAPRSFMKTYHINPAEALKVHRDVRARTSIGMHWGTFPLTAEAPMAPVVELERQKKEQQISDEEFSTMIMGETLTFPIQGKAAPAS